VCREALARLLNVHSSNTSSETFVLYNVPHSVIRCKFCDCILELATVIFSAYFVYGKNLIQYPDMKMADLWHMASCSLVEQD
jgi:hypothetical protein